MKRNFSSRLRRAYARSVEAGNRQSAGTTERVGADSEYRAALQGRLDRDHRRFDRLPANELAVVPDGETIENERGSCYLRTLRYPLSTIHGDLPLELALAADCETLAILAKEPNVEEVDLRECLFLDTETTGLSGGAGTVVFMTGLGYFEGSDLVVEQTFLRSYAEEPAALFHVKERLARYRQMVTFVGKSFDRHRLASRMAVHRVRSRVLSSRHLDLYHMARRLWKDELPDVRLATVEQHRLGFVRDDDLPGSEAPEAFLSYVREGTGPIGRVFEHNRLDVLSLVTLLGILGKASVPRPVPRERRARGETTQRKKAQRKPTQRKPTKRKSTQRKKAQRKASRGKKAP